MDGDLERLVEEGMPDSSGFLLEDMVHWGDPI